MEWGQLFGDEKALGLYAALFLFAYKHLSLWLAQRYRFKAEEWEGLVVNAFLAAEGIAHKLNWNGATKLRYAKNAFAAEYERLKGKKPSVKDLAKAGGDFAKKAWEMSRKRGFATPKSKEEVEA